MRTVLLALLLSCSMVGSAQGIYFARAELEAAADSALKGMQSAADNGQLRAAVRQYTRAINKYEEAYLNCDSAMRSQVRISSRLRTDVDELEDTIYFRDQKIAKLKPWAAIGKITTICATVAVAVVAVVVVKQEFDK